MSEAFTTQVRYLGCCSQGPHLLLVFIPCFREAVCLARDASLLNLGRLLLLSDGIARHVLVVFLLQNSHRVLLDLTVSIL